MERGSFQFQPLPEPGVGSFAPAGDQEMSSLRSVFDQLRARVTVVDRYHRYLYANREVLEFFDKPTSEIIGHHVSELLGDEIFAAYLPFSHRILSGESFRWDGWIEYPHRGRRFVEQQWMPYFSSAGEIIGMIAIARDVTAQKTLELELAAQVSALALTRTLKAAIVDCALAGIMAIDSRGRVIEFNRACESMFKLSREDVGDVRRIFPAKQLLELPLGHVQLTEDGRTPVDRGPIRGHAVAVDGTEFPVEMLVWKTAVEGDELTTISLIDLTERLQQRHELERQREALRQSEKLSAMGSLLAGVAHELNNPMAVVMGRAMLLEEKLGEPALQSDAKKVREAAERCARILRTFLNMARSRPATKTVIRINDLICAACDLLGYAFRSHDIACHLTLSEDLPSITGDADQIGQILLNLLINAQQALSTVPTPRRISIQSSCRRSDHEWLISVRVADSGPGIPEHVAGRIFEPYFTTKPEGIGTGLGLAVSRTMALSHGGDLVLSASSAKSGTEFELRLPVAAPSANSRSGGSFAVEQVESASFGRVLVVDDEAELAALMGEMLAKHGHSVQICSSGAEALEILKKHTFDAIACDLWMPDMDGAAFQHQIRRLHPDVANRIVFVTGDMSAVNSPFLEGSGCISIEKPFDKKQLAESIDLAMRKGR